MNIPKDSPCYGCMYTTVCLAEVIRNHPNAKNQVLLRKEND